MVGAGYEPPFPYIPASEYGEKGHTVLPADFVSAEDGTGIVHTAIAFGEDDFRLGAEQGLAVINPVRGDGTYDERIGPYAGRFVKEADNDLIEDLRGARPPVPGRASAARLPALLALRHAAALLRQAVLVHQDLAAQGPPARGQRERRLAPGAHQARPHGPLAGEQRGLGALPRALLGHAAPGLAQRGRRDRLHRLVRGAGGAVRRQARGPAPPVRGRRGDPVADRRRAAAARPRGDRRLVRLRLACRSPSGTRRSRTRTSSSEQFPADYICEGIDQTRGWFYSLLAISTLLFDQSSYKTCLSLGHIADETGKKMSKSLGNIVVPWDVIDRHGADAFRWYFLSTKLPWEGYNFDTDTVGESLRQFLLQLWNTYGFYVLYANVNDVAPSDARAGQRPRPLGALAPGRDGRDGHRPAGALRRHPRRPGDPGVRRRSLELVRAPLAPPLLGRRPGRVRDAAHRARHGDEAARAVTSRSSPTRSTATSTAPSRASTCATGPRSASATRRSSSRWRPCARPSGSASPPAARPSSRCASRCARPSWSPPAPSATRSSACSDVALDELNVKEIRYVSQADELGSYEVKPNYRALGPRFGKHMPHAAAAVAALDPAHVADALRSGAHRGDQRRRARPRARRRRPDARDEPARGLPARARGLARRRAGARARRRAAPRGPGPRDRARDPERAQGRRACRSRTASRSALGGDEELLAAGRAHEDYVKRETLALSVEYNGASAVDAVTIEGKPLHIAVQKA